MTMLPILLPPIKPVTTVGDLKFLTVGDGKLGPSQAPPPEIQTTSKGAPYYKFSAVAQNEVTKTLVFATEQPDAAFVVADDRASDFYVADEMLDFTGYCERLHYITSWNKFVGQANKDASHAMLVGDGGGLIWGAFLAGSGYVKQHSGFAYSPSLDRVIATLVGGDTNVLLFNGSGWSSHSTNDIGGYSVVWYPPLNRFIGYRPGSQTPKQSNFGTSWTNYMYNLPVPCGTAAGPFSVYLIPLDDGNGTIRILIFTSGGTAPAWYSDNHGQNWTACIGMENTGPVSRYVAVDGNAVYVAFQADLNKGMVSFDYGKNWERSDHLSGNASGVIALN